MILRLPFVRTRLQLHWEVLPCRAQHAPQDMPWWMPCAFGWCTPTTVYNRRWMVLARGVQQHMQGSTLRRWPR